MPKRSLNPACLIGFFLLISGLLNAQEPYYIHWDVQKGLPSDEVYGIVFDNQRILWANTDRGVFRYDGYNYRQFTVSDGLPENTNLRIFKDPQGRIWVSGLNNSLSYFENDSVVISPFSRSTIQLGGFRQYIQQIEFNSDGSINLCYNRPGLFHFVPGQRPDSITAHKRKIPDADLCIFYNGEHYIWDMIGYPKRDPSVKSKLTRSGNEYYLSSGILPMINTYRKDLHPIGPDEFLFSYGHKVFHIRGESIIAEKNYRNEVVDVFIDREGNFWVGLLIEGAFKYPGGDLNSKPVRFLQNESISGIAQDHEGNLWFSTLNDGLYQCGTLSAAVYYPNPWVKKENSILTLATDGNTIFLGTLTGKMWQASPVSGGIYELKEMPVPLSTGAIRRIIRPNEKEFILYRDTVWMINKNGKQSGFGNIPGYAYDGAKLPDGQWLISFFESFRLVRDGKIRGLINSDTLKHRFPDNPDAGKAVLRARTLLIDNQDRLWIGSHDGGLFSMDGESITSWASKDSLLRMRTRDIIQAGKDIWVSVSDYGILIIHPDSTMTRLTKKNNLSSDIVDVMYAAGDDVVWAGTGGGLNKITVTGNPQDPYLIEYYTQTEGLPSNRIYDITGLDGKIWLATEKGAIEINPDIKEPPHLIPSVYFEKMEVNGQMRELNSPIVLKPDENNLVFRYKSISYLPFGSIRYWYRLNGVDTDWIRTEDIEARYPDLPPGLYSFQVTASYDEKLDDQRSIILSFRILKKWYQTILFKGFLILLALTASAGSSWLIYKGQKKKAMMKQKLLMAEKRALLAQMNPHFIFNSLNSIQHFIVQHDELHANNYLTDFSSLIRRTLENSRKNMIFLVDEIDTLRLYLEMEKLRFEEEFDYKIDRDPGIDYNVTMIPPMLIQPLVENAIWHGLTPLKTKGSLNISFIRNQKHFICRIEDNGVGRDHASNLKGKRNSHESTGMKNLEERISLLNQMNSIKILLTVLDLKDAAGNATGTLVELEIPFNLKYQD